MNETKSLMDLLWVLKNIRDACFEIGQ